MVSSNKWKGITENDIDSPADPPSLPLHIQLCVEDSEERLTDTQVEELIQLSKKYLIPPPAVES